jgi:hypothetical protein
LYIIGANAAQLSFNPNSIVSLPRAQDGTAPEIGTIKPTLDSDSMLRQVETLMGLLLTTKSLSVNGALPGLTVQNASSGVAKMLDNAESTEDRRDQIAYFESAEVELWDKLAHNIYPVWNNSIIEPEYKKVFSPVFELSISYPELRPAMSEKEKLEIQIQKLDNALTTHEIAIHELNPELSSEQVKQIMIDIAKEKAVLSALPIDEPESA